MMALVIEPQRPPVFRDILPGYETLQSLVGGRIQYVYPFEDLVGLVCNDDGKDLRLPLNRTLRDEDGNVYDIIAGTFVIVGLDQENGDTCSLSPELAEKYRALFRKPDVSQYRYR